MSIGYIPRKRAIAKKKRKLRKKYKNFSCDTCVKCHNLTCKKRYKAIRFGRILVTYYENCPDWQVDRDYIPIPHEKLQVMTPEKKKRKISWKKKS